MRRSWDPERLIFAPPCARGLGLRATTRVPVGRTWALPLGSAVLDLGPLRMQLAPPLGLWRGDAFCGPGPLGGRPAGHS